eukprot:11644285-Ditylum_brightwellii.AAC.1
MPPCLNEAHLINNISSEQPEATQKPDKYVDDEYEVQLKEFDNTFSLSFMIDCTMHDNRDGSVRGEIKLWIRSKCWYIKKK